MSTNRREFTKKAVVTGTSIPLLAGCLDGTTGGDGEFPSDTIDLVVPGGAGGGTDTYAREIGPAMGDILDVPVDIDNRPGGNQLIGPGHVASQEADGYSVAVVNLPAVPAGWLIEEPDFDLTEFEGLGGFAAEGGVLVVNEEYADDDPEEFLDRYRDGELSDIGVVHLGSFHMMGAVLESDEYLDVDFEWIGYPDAAEHNRAVAGGEIPAAFSSEAGAADLVEEGEIHAMLTSEDTDLFDAPSLPDLDYPEADFISQSRGLAVPQDVPDENKDVLADALDEAVNSDRIQDWAEETDQNIEYVPRDEFDDNYHQIFDDLPELIDLEEFQE